MPDQAGAVNEPQLETLKTTLQQIDVLYSLFERHPVTFGFVDRADDILPVFRSGRIASLLGIEGLHQIANSASVLHMYYRLGVRYATLCHDKSNIYCESAMRMPASAPSFGAQRAAHVSDRGVRSRTQRRPPAKASRMRAGRLSPR